MTTKAYPLVSVIVPSYNYAHLIERCIDSVLEQTYTNWELIVCDDCSDDGSVSLLHQRYGHDTRVRIYSNECRLGIFGNIARAIGYSSGPFLKILMADDWLHVDYLTATLDLFDAHPSIGLCSVRTTVFSEASQLVETRFEPDRGQDFYPSERILWWTTREVNPIGNPSRLIFRRLAYEEVGGFDLGIEYCTDLDLWIRMLEHWDIGFVCRILSHESLHSSNATLSYVRRAQHLRTGEQMFLKLFQRHRYYQGHWWVQKSVWIFGWREYWITAIRHLVAGSPVEFETLIGIMSRRVPFVLWAPVLLWRLGGVVMQKVVNRLHHRH
ncbi:MAG: glycosyltransferase [Anaerolineae bacterium]|nr:glycosyltransferase [Anaerolineae bacterium]